MQFILNHQFRICETSAKWSCSLSHSFNSLRSASPLRLKTTRRSPASLLMGALRPSNRISGLALDPLPLDATGRVRLPSVLLFVHRAPGKKIVANAVMAPAASLVTNPFAVKKLRETETKQSLVGRIRDDRFYLLVLYLFKSYYHTTLIYHDQGGWLIYLFYAQYLCFKEVLIIWHFQCSHIWTSNYLLVVLWSF